jgi:SET domain-containing protein
MIKKTQTSSSKPRVKTSSKETSKTTVKAKPATPSKQSSSSRLGNSKALVRESTIHGRGVIARIDLKAGERVCEYKGERIDWPEALRRHPHDPAQPFHTFYFSVNDDLVIDGNVDGDFSRFMNHSCAPNCEAEMVEIKGQTRIFIQAMTDIPSGTELVYNYGLTLDERYTPKLKKEFACYCGSAKCIGTMLSPKR